MLLRVLIEQCDLPSCLEEDVEITSITCDSRRVRPGSLFFALKGAESDGHQFITQAEKAGAAAVVLEDAEFAPVDIPWVLVGDARSTMATMAAGFNGNPTAHLPLIGITGTNGKTTTTYLVEAILEAAGIPAAIFGSISYRFGSTAIEASHTTPESTELQAAFRRMADAGAHSFVMEVSSHALKQKRVDGCHFDIGVFSNLTRDHLDYHGSMNNYLTAKLRLFSELLHPTKSKPRRRAVINMDDAFGPVMAMQAACPVITYGIGHQADIRAVDVTSTISGINGTLVTPKGQVSFSSRLLGSFNLSNILAAASTGIALDLPLEAIKNGIENHAAVPGRLEPVKNVLGVTCLVDYAHTGDALENVLSTLREICSGRIITVFGCGGDRDRGKRPIMGQIATQMSDLAIITSDNPRTEDPFSIMEQIKRGISHPDSREYRPDELAEVFVERGFVMLEQRREAIRLAIRMARPNDIILLAGKGHEDYQMIGTVKHHFDDREEALMAFQENGTLGSY